MAFIGLSLLFASFIVVCLRPPAWLPGFLAGLRQKTLGGPTIRPLIKPDDPQDGKERKEKDKSHKQEKEQQQTPASSVEDQARRNKDDNDDKIALAPPPIIIATEPVQDTVAEEESQAEDQQTTPRAVPTIFQVDGESSSDSDVVPVLITPDSPPKIVEPAQPPSNISNMPLPPQLNVVPEIPATITTTSSAPGTRSMPPPPVPFNKRPSQPSVIPQPSSSSSSATTSSLSTSSLPRRVPTLNNSLSPAPTRERNLPIPRRGAPPSSSSSSLGGSLLPPPTATSIPKKPSRAVTLEPGHSPLDWARLAQSPTSDLRNLPPNTPYLRVTPSMLREQNGRKGRDAWTAYGGKVYNVSPYIPFHPGGKGELLRGAGKDGTRLFAEVHPWVNYETMLQSCLIGLLVEEHETVNEMEEMD